jgi:capsular polysaccharide biosynthesis protein
VSNPFPVPSVPERLAPPFEGPPPSGRRSPVLVSVAVGVLIAALVGIAGIYYAVRRPVRYSAVASIVVLPDKTLENSVAIGAFDTLSRGQVTATFSEILRRQDLQKNVVQQLHLSKADGDSVTIDVAVVANTSLISVDATASKSSVAERVANAVVNTSKQYESSLAIPYRSAVVASASGTAQRSGTSKTTLIGAFAVVAIVAGFAAQQGTYQVLVLRRRLRVRPGWDVLPGNGQRAGMPADELFGRPGPPPEIHWRPRVESRPGLRPER